MVKNRAQPAADDSLWTCGLSLADFEVPSMPTQVAQAASVVAAVTLDLADAMTSGGDTTMADEIGHELVEVLDLNGQEVTGWIAAEDVEDADYANRKVLWPALDPSSYQPSTSVQTRIEDNITAVRLVKALAEQQRTPTAPEMTQLLRYSGWGGVSRVFSPDGTTPQPLAALRNELQAITTAEEYAAMQASVNTSFYTPPELVKALWSVVQRLGFKGGRVIEPSAGVGHVLAGMPHALARKSSLTAVELDPTSAAMLERCYAPYGLQVHACGLEEAKLPLGFFDLVIGNAPFGQFKTNDTSKAPYSDWLIHNWFLGKSMELVRPGGLVALITSRGSLDSKTDTHRRWLAAHADLVAAFRLPTMAFEAHANTEAVTDIVVFKRRELPDFASKPIWVDAAPAEQALFAQGEPTSISQYHRANGASYTLPEHVNAHFNRHPASMLGRLKWTSTQHGKSALPIFDGDMAALAQRLATRVKAT